MSGEAVLQVIYRDPRDLTPYKGNARTHSPEQIAQIAASIREFGFASPILLKDDETQIGAGHARREAALLLGLTSVPTITLHGLSESKWRAFVLADNKLALNAGWDEDALQAEIAALTAVEFDTDILGFNADELAALLNPPSQSEADPDQTPEPPAFPVSQAGDVWILGGHRIVCGDSTNGETVATLLQGAKPHLMVTDPPYGVNYDPNWRNETADSTGHTIGATAVGKVLNDDRADWSEAWALFPGDVAYVWHAGNKAHIVATSLIDAGLEIRSQLVWAKHRMVIGRGHYHPHHEPCWYAVRKGASGRWSGDRKQTTLWQIQHQKSDTGHSTQKPVECMKRPIENNSKPGEAVYEPFSGSGTTIIAAEMTGRRCYAIELSPAYVDVAVRRWEEFTGKTAALEATGQTFQEVQDERRRQAAA